MREEGNGRELGVQGRPLCEGTFKLKLKRVSLASWRERKRTEAEARRDGKKRSIPAPKPGSPVSSGG